jgi:heptosyltransferase-2
MIKQEKIAITCAVLSHGVVRWIQAFLIFCGRLSQAKILLNPADYAAGRQHRSEQLQKILVIAPAWVGDLVMTQALFKLLKTKNSACTIDVLANKNLCPVLKHMPEVDSYLTMPFEHSELKLFARFKFAHALRKNNYTHAYIIPNSFKSALIPFWANIPIRTGWRGEFRYGLINDIRKPLIKDLLFVDSLLNLELDDQNSSLRNLYLPKLRTQSKPNISNKPILALCPGAEYGATKRWPTKYFAEIAQIKHQDGWDVWIIGGPKDAILAQEIQKYSDNICTDFTGKTNLSQAIELLAQANVALTNDSGLMHVAASVGIKIIAIYGSTSPKFTPPLTHKAETISLNLSCGPCFKKICPLKHIQCLNDLSPNFILPFLC